MASLKSILTKLTALKAGIKPKRITDINFNKKTAQLSDLNNLDDSDVVLTLPANTYAIDGIRIAKPAYLSPGNIKKDITIMGVKGDLDVNCKHHSKTKTYTQNCTNDVIRPDTGYSGLDKVTITVNVPPPEEGEFTVGTPYVSVPNKQIIAQARVTKSGVLKIDDTATSYLDIDVHNGGTIYAGNTWKTLAHAGDLVYYTSDWELGPTSPTKHQLIIVNNFDHPCTVFYLNSNGELTSKSIGQWDTRLTTYAYDDMGFIYLICPTFVGSYADVDYPEYPGSSETYITCIGTVDTCNVYAISFRDADSETPAIYLDSPEDDNS